MGSIEQILATGAIIGAVGGFLMGYNCRDFSADSVVDNHEWYNQNFVLIPKTSDVKPGYLDPRLLSIERLDIDGDSVQDTIYTYDGKRYVAVIENGHPVFKELEVVLRNPED